LPCIKFDPTRQVISCLWFWPVAGQKPAYRNIQPGSDLEELFEGRVPPAIEVMRGSTTRYPEGLGEVPVSELPLLE